MKKLITFLLILFPVLLSAQEKKIDYMNFPISIGIGYENLFSLDHVSIEKYTDWCTARYNYYEGQVEYYQNKYNETGDYSYLRSLDLYEGFMDNYKKGGLFDEKFNSSNLTVFAKVNLWRFHIIPTYSLPLTKKSSNYDYEKEVNESYDYPYRIEKPFSPTRFKTYGEPFLCESSYVSSEIKQARKGIYFTFDVIKTKGSYPFTMEIGMGIFNDTRKMQFTESTYIYQPVYTWDGCTTRNGVFMDVFYLDLDESYSFHETPSKVVDINKTTKEYPLLISMGWKNVRMKMEWVISKDFDSYGTWGMELIF